MARMGNNEINFLYCRYLWLFQNENSRKSIVVFESYSVPQISISTYLHIITLYFILNRISTQKRYDHHYLRCIQHIRIGHSINHIAAINYTQLPGDYKSTRTQDVISDKYQKWDYAQLVKKICRLYFIIYSFITIVS